MQTPKLLIIVNAISLEKSTKGRKNVSLDNLCIKITKRETYTNESTTNSNSVNRS